MNFGGSDPRKDGAALPNRRDSGNRAIRNAGADLRPSSFDAGGIFLCLALPSDIAAV